MTEQTLFEGTLNDLVKTQYAVDLTKLDDDCFIVDFYCGTNHKRKEFKCESDAHTYAMEVAIKLN